MHRTYTGVRAYIHGVRAYIRQKARGMGLTRPPDL